MNIPHIKNSVNILQIAEELGVSIDKKTKRACCPFHNDKTPSLQFSLEKQIATCFSPNCSAGTMDVIELVKKKTNWELPKALEWLTEKTGSSKPIETLKSIPTKEDQTYATDFEQMKSSLIASSIARNYSESRKLNWKTLEIGYNAFKQSKFNYLRGCITFGLKNEQGKIVSMYGRSVRDNDKSKHYYTADRKGLYPSQGKRI